ncbi:MAG TPA: hypothetical protein VFB72_20685, partial [Verrucomicrobiae bacterium]|nr:hypothetical protein [Verrucomicrobiae bacterium]
MPEYHKGLSSGTKLRLTLIVVAFFVLAGYATFFFLQREPSYAGEPLSRWMDALGRGEIEVNNTAPQKAILEIGPRAIPFLVEWLKPPKPPSNFR